MAFSFGAELHNLPETIVKALSAFIEAAQRCFREDLKSVVLYGSGAEGRLRPTSDVNVLIVLTAFDSAKAASFREPFLAAEAAIQLTGMFVLESEIQAASELFGQKFSDIIRRHLMLFGADPFENIHIPRAAVILRTKQVLLNLTLRLREGFIQRGSTPEKISGLIADSAGPLRTCAATLNELEGKPAGAPKEALENFIHGLQEPGWDEVLAHITEVRGRTLLTASTADATLVKMIELALRLRTRVDVLL